MLLVRLDDFHVLRTIQLDRVNNYVESLAVHILDAIFMKNVRLWE